MSAKARTDVQKLRRKYARHFQINLADVDTEELVDDWIVYAPKHPDLPKWSLGYND
jgi:hypothetical protein